MYVVTQAISVVQRRVPSAPISAIRGRPGFASQRRGWGARVAGRGVVRGVSSVVRGTVRSAPGSAVSIKGRLGTPVQAAAQPRRNVLERLGSANGAGSTGVHSRLTMRGTRGTSRVFRGAAPRGGLQQR